jgi:methyl-accepting chemotaxis protein
MEEMKRSIIFASLAGILLLTWSTAIEAAEQAAKQARIEDARQIAQKLMKEFPEPYSLDYGQTETIGNFVVPLLMSGGQALDSDSVFNIFNSNTHADTTFFVKIGNDFISVATTIKRENGSSVRGTALAYSNPAYRYLTVGSAYEGKVNLFGKDYMAKYALLKDRNGLPIGAYFVGLPISKGDQGLSK